MVRSSRASLVVLVLVGSQGCRGGQLPEVVSPRDVSTAHGRPDISEIIDLGGISLPQKGRIPSLPRDGRAVVGELLLVEGSGFGKQPTVAIGGRPAAVLARVEGGGLVVRVPWGIDPGEVEVEVTTAAGRHARTFPVRRVGLCATGGALWPLVISADGTVEAGLKIPLAGAEDLAISTDGSAAYLAGVVAGAPRLRVLDLTTAQPTVHAEHTLRGSKVLDVLAAEQAPVGVALTDTHLTVFETNDPLRLSLYNPVPLSDELRKKRILAGAIGGQGRALALLLGEQNQIAVLDLQDPARPGAPVFLDVLPGVPLSLVQDLRFSSDEGSLWVVSGDTPRSAGSGAQQLRITLVTVTRRESGLELAVHRTWELGATDAPRQLAVARGEPIPPGTVIRPEPSASAVYIAAVPSAWLSAGVGRQPAGAVLRSAVGQRAARLLSGQRLITSIDVVGKTQVLLGLGAEPLRQGQLQRTVISQRAWEKDDRPRVLQLDAVDHTSSPPWLGELRAQP